MINGEFLEALAEKREKTGVVTGEPDIETDMVVYWDAFWFLNSFRASSGFGIGPLALRDIMDYMKDLIEIDDEEDRDTFITLIRFMDSEYRTQHLDIQRQKQQEKPLRHGPRR